MIQRKRKENDSSSIYFYNLDAKANAAIYINIYIFFFHPKIMVITVYYGCILYIIYTANTFIISFISYPSIVCEAAV